MALAMGKWGCWLAVAVHIVVRGKEAIDQHLQLPNWQPLQSYCPCILQSAYLPCWQKECTTVRKW